jgi:hypothetical protein
MTLSVTIFSRNDSIYDKSKICIAEENVKSH